MLQRLDDIRVSTERERGMIIIHSGKIISSSYLVPGSSSQVESDIRTVLFWVGREHRNDGYCTRIDCYFTLLRLSFFGCVYIYGKNRFIGLKYLVITSGKGNTQVDIM